MKSSAILKSALACLGLVSVSAVHAESFGRVGVILTGAEFAPGKTIAATSGDKFIAQSNAYRYDLVGNVKSPSNTVLASILGPQGMPIAQFLEFVKPGSSTNLSGNFTDTDGKLGGTLVNLPISGTKTLPNIGKVTISFNVSASIADNGVCKFDVANVKFTAKPKLTPAQVASLGSLKFMAGSKLTVNAAPRLVFKRTNTSVDENAGSVSVVVWRDTNKYGRVTVDYATVNGTAGSADFTPTSGTVVFGDTETQKTITVPILDNEINDAARTFTIQLSNPQGFKSFLGPQSSTMVTIRDNE